MKQLSVSEQRTLYKSYKETRLKHAYNQMALMKTGAENSVQSQKLLQQAKEDILSFSAVFEEKIVDEVKNDLSNIQ